MTTKGQPSLKVLPDWGDDDGEVVERDSEVYADPETAPPGVGGGDGEAAAWREDILPGTGDGSSSVATAAPEVASPGMGATMVTWCSSNLTLHSRGWEVTKVRRNPQWQSRWRWRPQW